MERSFIELTEKDIEFKTNSNKRLYQHTKDKVQHYEIDDGKESREASLECKCCYYIRNTMGFSAMTMSYCGICKEPILNGSSDTDRICDKCAGTKGLCVHCGGEMD